MITRIQTTDFTLADRVDDDKPSMVRGVPFEIGDEVLVIPYTIGTTIGRANGKYYLIETDALNIRERTVVSYNVTGKMVRFPRFREDKVIICKFDEMPYTELIVDDFEMGYVRRVKSSVIKIGKEDREHYHTALLYDKDLTNVKRLDDGRFKIMSYSPSIVSEYPQWRANRSVLNVPNYWLGKEVMVIKW